MVLSGTQLFGGDPLTPEEVNGAILKQYVEAQVRLGEEPALDLSVVSVEQLSAAYADLANEKDVAIPLGEESKLFVALHDKAVEEGLACK